MNKIEKLIDELCSDGVEFKGLGEVCEIKTGKAVSKVLIQKNPGEYPVINSGKDPLGYINIFNTENDPIGITSRGAGVGSITYCKGKYFRGNLNYSVTILDKNLINVRFLYHILINNKIGIQALCSFNGIPALNASKLKTFQISIPPIKIQEEIVKILDNFTQLEAELEAELEARKQQYEYYRDEMLSFGEEVEFKGLGNFWNKAQKSKIGVKKIENLGKGKIKCFTSGVKTYFVNDFLVDGKYIFVNDGGVADFKYNIGKAYYTDHVFAFGINDKEINSKYIYYYLKNNQDLVNETMFQGSGLKNLQKKLFEKFKIPIPPIKIQEEIVKILDNFTQLEAELEAELEARRKQYEYYRGKLLDFKEMKK